ncbi:MAG: acyl-CoA dehydratase activase [Desulfitobacteriaceae bacterium]|nr:acyl-CoA dehydratase activase [Desulfitobacteriaceae bacterium]MDD4346197.1 acyl-CoA dehydratase activase [Desulfitobacteriaceae bacterium]MDD4401164.1 acyl-CoA dehydratase activase [Desulfitobacteriaceae bacterium]
MFYRAGLDIGSSLAKAVILKDDEIMAYGIAPISGNFSRAADQVMQETLEKSGLRLEQLDIIGGTGLGASFIPYRFVKNTEVSCQSRGVHYLLPTARIVIEIGYQASRVIKITENGKVADCVVNDRCAAGSGRILQVISKVLQVPLTELGNMSLKSTNPVRFTTGCSVFAETEAISRIAEGAKVEDIIAGLHQAISLKISGMLEKIKLDGECAITGGGGKDAGLVKMLEKTLQKEMLLPAEPLISGAIGAVLMATEKTQEFEAAAKQEE